MCMKIGSSGEELPVREGYHIIWKQKERCSEVVVKAPPASTGGLGGPLSSVVLGKKDGLKTPEEPYIDMGQGREGDQTL